MDGRGAASGFTVRLPNYQRAVILNDKVKNYLLHPSKSNGKAAFFKAIGYSTKDAKRFSRDIRRGLKENKALVYFANQHGNVVYNVIMNLGTGAQVPVLTVWQIDKGSNRPRLITAYKAGR